VTTVPSEAGTGGVPKTALFRTSATLEQEFRDLLLRRSRLIFVLGLAISVVMIGVARLVIVQPNLFLESLGLARAEWAFDALHLLSFALALASTFVGNPTAERLEGTVLATIALNVVVGHFSMGGTLDPDYPPALGAALMLFVPAAVIPWRTRYQIWLGVVTVLAFVLAHALAYSLSSWGASYWAAAGGTEAFRDSLVITSLGLAILAGTSVLVTDTLYSMRKRTQQARILGSYLVRREIGRGGMGRVYVAQHAMMVRPAAVKVLDRGGGLTEEALARFEREVQLSSRLTHPNTITIYDYGRAADNTFYYAMELLEGQDLEKLVRQYGPVPAERAGYLLMQVCGSLAEAHDRGIVHRDLKPSNIFVTNQGCICDFVKVLDFGIAKQLEVEGEGEITRAGFVVGTPMYMAPESALCPERVDARTDIYSLGAVAYWMLTGKPPFTEDSPLAIIASHLRSIPIPPSELAEEEVPPALDAVVLRCLEKEPEDRFASARELKHALGRITYGQPWTAERAGQWWVTHRPEEAPPGFAIETPPDPFV
jgi:serine/threonine-protein kinase